MTMQKGVYVKKPKPKARPARYVDTDAIKEQITDTINQETQYAP